MDVRRIENEGYAQLHEGEGQVYRVPGEPVGTILNQFSTWVPWHEGCSVTQKRCPRPGEKPDSTCQELNPCARPYR